jgi:hypothetical protein
MSPELLQLIAWSTLDTLTMVALAGAFGTLVGLPLGVFLATSRANELFPAPMTNRLVGLVVNATRSKARSAKSTRGWWKPPARSAPARCRSCRRCCCRKRCRR